jgi:hypothetical protein
VLAHHSDLLYTLLIPQEGNVMRVVHLSLAVWVSAAGLVAAENPFLGAWKVNIAKSQFKPGPGPKAMTVTFAEDGELIKRTAEGVDGEGKAVSTQSSIKWDGQDHAVDNPSGTATTVAVRKIDNRTVEYIVKNDGKVTITGRAVVSRDGKTVTSTETGVNAKGEKVHNVVVSERQ